MNEVVCKITGTTQVLIKGRTPAVDLQQPLYAINWFSTKIAWMYHLYNFLASKSLTKIGGQAFFKGKITQTILDEYQAERSLLLVVNYPNGVAFKQLLESFSFKMVSVLRMLAVKQFSFGFTSRQEASSSILCQNLAYVVHHFKTTTNWDSQVFQKVLPPEVSIKYAGNMVAELLSQQQGKKDTPIPNIMDGIVIYEAKNKASILEMIETKNYQSILEQMEASYIGVIHRML